MIITRTLLRVSFFGRGTDLPGFFAEHGGAVPRTAIDEYIYRTVPHLPSQHLGYEIRFAYRMLEHVKSLGKIEYCPI